MPELPEAERARKILEQAVARTVAHVDDRDTYVCRPHSPGELDAALTGHRFVSAQRRGKFLWMETDDGPTLGLHLGMAGRIVLNGRAEHERWDRFTVEFEDGTWFALQDKRRLGRAILNPDFSHVGPDAADISRDQFRERVGAGNTAIKARLLDQHALAGVGNLLADQTLWQARIAPGRLTGSLDEQELDRLRRELRAAIRDAIREGGVHTGEFIPARRLTHLCPRCGHDLQRGRLGGRTTYWCPVCQP
ncbi:MAG: Fpg/Nei family DNA glycosylase [Solirubrobacteraceae bacterium]